MAVYAYDKGRVLVLVPAVYSKAQTAAEIIMHLKALPSQNTSDPGAELHTIDFQVEGKGPYGTLSELQKTFPQIDYYLIFPRSGSGNVVLSYNDGIFIIHEHTAKTETVPV